ncbi:hypothetical protein BsWGS_15300 [Bradybaena similaris]
MSWAADEWKDGLNPKALSKIREIEAHVDRLKKERDQKQFQVDSLEQALEVQKRKGTEKSEIATLQRENQSLVETCKDLEKTKEKLNSELALKDSEVASLVKTVAELRSGVPEKTTEPAENQHQQASDLQCEVIRSLEHEIAELRRQVEEKSDTANTSARAGLGDEGSSTKTLRHLSEGDGLRKTQQELQTLRALVCELEGKNKKLIQDGECTRHNTEAARLHLEVKMKESEKELKRELAQALEATKNAERILQETKVKWQQETNAANTEQSKFKGLMEKLEAENARLVREQEDLSKKLAAADDVVKTNSARVAEADKRKAALENEKQSLASELEHKAREVQAQSAELMKLKNDIGQREQASDILKGQLADRTLETEKLKAEADAASHKLLLVENQLAELQKLQQKTDDRLKEVSLTLIQVQTEKETLEGSNLELGTQLQKIQEELQTASTSLNDAQAQVNEVKCNFTESQNKWNDLEKTLRQELSQSLLSVAELSEQKLALGHQLSAKDAEIVELGNRCEASEKKVSSKDDELSQKSQDIVELEKQLQMLHDQHDVLKQEHLQQEMLAKEKTAQLEMAVIEKTQELEMFVIQTSQDKTAFEAEIQKLMEENQTVKLEINSCRVECESGKVLIASLNEEIKALKEVLENRDTLLAQAELAIQNMDKELGENKKENEAMRSGVSQRDQEIQLMKEKLHSAEKELEISQKELQVVGERCEALETEKVLLVSEIEECKRQDNCKEQVKELLEKQVADLQSQFDLSQNECSTLSEQVRSEQEKVALLEKAGDSLHNKCCELESRVSVYIADLESKSAVCRQLEEQCLQLSQTLGSQNAENADLSSKISSLETQIAECSKRHQQMVDELHEQLQEAHRSSDEHRGLLEQKDNHLMELEHEIIRLKNGTSDLESVCLSQKVEIDEKTVLIHSLEKSCASLGDELEVLKLKVTEGEHQLSSHLENLSQMQNKMGHLEEEKKALETSATEQLDVLQKELLRHTQDLSQKASLITELEEQAQDLSCRLSEAQKEAVELDARYTQDLSQNASRIKELEEQAQDLSCRLSEAQKEAAELDTRHAQEVGTLKAKLDMLEMDVEDSDGHVKDLNGKVSDLSSRLEKVTHEKDSLQETLQSLSVEVGELKMNLESEQTCLVQVKQERDRMTEENGNLKIKLEQMTSLMHSLENTHTSLTEKLQTLQLRMVEKECVLISQLENLSQQENNMRQLEEEKKTLEISVAEQLDVLQKKLLKHTQDLNQKASMIAELEEQIQDLSSRLSEAEKKAVELASQQAQDLSHKATVIADLEKQIQDLSSRLSEAEKKTVELEAKYTHDTGILKSKLAMLEMDVEDSGGHVRDLDGKVSDLTALLEKATQERDRLIQALQPLSEEIEELKMTLESEQTSLVQVKQEREKLSEENSSLKSTLIEIQSELERKVSLYEEKEYLLGNIQKDNGEIVKLLKDCEAERDVLMCRAHKLEQSLYVEQELVLAKTKEMDMLTENCSLLSKKLETVTEELSEKIMAVSSITQSLQAVECKLKDVERNSVVYEERVQKEIEELRLLVLQRDESLVEAEKTREELENVIEDLKCKLSQAQQLNGVLQEEQIAAGLRSELEMQKNVEDKNCVVQELNNKICDLERQVEKMAQEKVEMCEIETSLRSDMLGLKSALEVERENAAHGKLNENSLNDKIKHLDSALADTRRELEGNEKHLQALQEQCGSLITRSDQQKKLFSDERDQLKAAMEDLQLCLASEKQMVWSRTSDLEAVTHRCAELTEHLENVKVELSRVQTELDSQVQEQQVMGCRLKDQEAEMMRLEVSREELEQLQQKLLEKQMELDQRASRVDELEKEIVDITSKFNDVQREKDEEGIRNKQEAAKLNSQLEMLQMDYESEDCEVKELRAKISTLLSETESVINEKVKLAGVVDDLNTELLQLRSFLDVEREKATQAKMSEDMLKDRIKFLEAALSKVTFERQEQEICLQNVQSEYESAKENINKYEKVIKEYQINQDNVNTMIRNGHEALDEQKLLVDSKTLELNVANEQYAAVLEELEMMKSEVINKQNEIDARVQDVLQLENKISQFEKEKAAVKDELSRDIKQLQEKLLQDKGQLYNESKVDVDINQQDLNAQIADEQCERRGLHSEEESVLKCKQDTLEVVNVHEECGSDQGTNSSGLTDQEDLSSQKPGMRDTCQAINCQGKVAIDCVTTQKSCVGSVEYTERQKKHIEHLKLNLLKVKKALLENRQGFSSFMNDKAQIEISQKHNSSTTCDRGTEVAEFEHMILSVQQIVDYIMMDARARSSTGSDLPEELAAASHELSCVSHNFQHHEAALEDFHSHSFDAALTDTASKHPKMQIEDNNCLNAEIAGAEELQLQLSDLPEKESHAVGESSGAHPYYGKEITRDVTSLVDELRNEIEQKDQVIDGLANKNTDLETLLGAVNDENNQLQAKKASLESENSLLQESHGPLKEETTRLMSEIQRLLAAFADLENMLEEKTASLESKNQELIKLEKQLGKALDNCEDLKLSLSQKTDNISHLETTIEALESQLEVINNERANLAKCSSQEVEAIPLQLPSMIEDLEAKNKELEELKTQYDDVSRALVKSNSQLAELQVEKATLIEQLGDVEKLTKSYLQERDNTINILREELDSAAHENDALKSDKGEWQTREDKYRQEINDLEVKLADLNMEVVSTRESFESVSNQRFEAQGKLNSVLQDKRNLESKFLEIEAELDEAKRLVKNVENLEMELENMKQDTVVKNEEIQRLKAQLKEMSRSELGEIDSLQKEKDVLEKCLQEATERNRDLEEQLNEVTSVMNDMKEQLAQLQELMHTLNSSVDSKRKEIIQRVNEICEKNDEIAHLKAVLEEKEKMNNKMSNQITNIEKETSSTVGTLQDALESLNFELQAAEEEKNVLIGKNEILKKENLELHNKIKVLTNDSLQEADSSGEPRTQVSHQDFGTLQDALESLNFELKAVEEEKDALVSENENLKKESMELKEKIQKLAQDGKTASDELNKQSSSLEKVICELTDQVDSLERKNKDIKAQLEEKIKFASDLTLQIQSSNEQLQEKIILSENMTAQVQSLTADMKFSVKQISEKEAELFRRKETEECLNAKVSDMSNQITSLQLDLDCKNNEVQKLKDEYENILSKCQELENVIVKLQDEMKQVQAEADEAVKESLQTKEIAAANVSKFEQMIQDFNLAVIERDQLKERVQNLACVESDKKKLEEEFKSELHKKDALEKNVLELEKELIRRGSLDGMLETVELEKHSLRETLERVESANQMLGDKVKKMEKEIDDLGQGKHLLEKEIEDSMQGKHLLEKEIEDLRQGKYLLEKEIEDLRQGKYLLEKKVAQLELDNCGLEDKVEEVTKVADGLTSETISLQGKVVELESCKCQLEEKVKELDQRIENATVEKVSLQDEIKTLESSNCQLEEKLKQLDQRIENATLEKVSLQDEVKTLESINCQLEERLKEMDQMKENSVSEKVLLQDEIKKLECKNCHLEEKLKELDQMIKNTALEKVSLQGEIKKHESSNCQLEEKLKELEQLIKNAALEKVSLQDEVKKLKCSNCQFEGQLREQDQMIENAAIEKVSLHDEIKKLESSNCQLEDKLKELDQIKENAAIEKESLQNKVKKLECSNCQLEEKLKELDQIIENATLEKASLQDKLRMLDSANHLLEDQLKEIQATASESEAERALLESQLKSLQSKQSQPSDIQGSNNSEEINEQHKELLRKWEQRCSELNAQLAMDRKKVLRLTEQVEKLKSAKDVDKVDDSKFQALKEELEEVKLERDACQEKYMKMSEAAERHFNKSRDLQKVNEKLNSRNKMLNALVKGEKPRVIVPIQASSTSLRFGAQNLRSEPGSRGSTEASKTVEGNHIGPLSSEASKRGRESQQVGLGGRLCQAVSENTAGSSDADSDKTHSKLEESNRVCSHTKEKDISDADIVKADSLLQENITVSSCDKEELISDAGSVQIHRILEKNKLNLSVKEKFSFESSTNNTHSVSMVNNTVTWNTKEKPIPAEDSLNVVESNGNADSSAGSYSTRSSTRLRLHSPNVHSIQKARINTPKSAIPPQLVQSTQKQKEEFISHVAPLSKMHSQTLKDTELSLSKLKTSLKVPESPSSKFKKEAFAEVSVFKAVSMASRVPHPSTSASAVSRPVSALGEGSSVRQPSDVTDQLKPMTSPRASRRMSLQKRRSIDQSLESVGGKKTKLAVKEPLPETKALPGGKMSAQTSRLPQPASSRTGHCTGLPRPMRTRSKQEALPTKNALATVTNSPKKTPSQESKPRRMSRATAKKVTLPQAQAAEEGASECQIS